MAAAELPGTRLDLLRLTFVDPALEREFRSSWLDATRSHNLIWKLAALAYYLATSLLLSNYLPQPDHFLMDLRLWLGLPVIVLSILPVIFHQRLKWFSVMAFSLAVIVVFSITCIQLRNVQPPSDYLFLFDLTVIFVFSQHYNRTFFLHNVLMVTILGVIVFATIYGFGGSPMARNVPLWSFLMTLTALSLIGIFASYTREFFVRQNYASVRKLQQAKRHAERLADEATAALDAKSRFLAIVGHELRTPLNAIIGFSEMMLSGVVGPVKPDRAAGYVEHIHHSGKHLMELVESVLQYTRTGSGMIRLEEEVIPPQTLIDNVLAEVKSMLQLRHQTLSISVPAGIPDLRIDARQVGHCLANLISNASKFSSVGSEIACKVLVAGDMSMQIVVTDTGAGFDDRKTELLFDPFAQADDGLDRRTGGLGIGLPLTRALMHAHDGDVRISSQTGVGTVAILVFPADRCLYTDAVGRPSVA